LFQRRTPPLSKRVAFIGRRPSGHAFPYFADKPQLAVLQGVDLFHDISAVSGDAVLGRFSRASTEIARRASQLGHLGAMVGQHHRAVRPAEYSCQIDDFRPGQRAGTLRRGFTLAMGRVAKRQSRQTLLPFRSRDTSRALREPDRRRRDEKRPFRSEQKTGNKPNNHLTEKLPHKSANFRFLARPLLAPGGSTRGISRRGARRS